MVAPAAGIDIRDSIDGTLAFLKPLSVLLRCRLGLAFSTEPDEELVLLRECKLLAFFAVSFSC
jgi:hypothetical protein